MNLSKLVLNPRSTRVRIEVARPYQMHRTILRAFPDSDSGGPGRVLFRMDTGQAGDLRLLVQSETEPDWSFLGEAPDYTLPDGLSTRQFDPRPVSGEERVFRLRANPTVKRDGKRYGLLQHDEQVAWLERKGTAGGFQVRSLSVTPEGFIRDRKEGKGGQPFRMSFFAVRYEGVLRVSEADVFLETLKSGVGSGKGLGFGLLSIAPKTGE